MPDRVKEENLETNSKRTIDILCPSKPKTLL